MTKEEMEQILNAYNCRFIKMLSNWSVINDNSTLQISFYVSPKAAYQAFMRKLLGEL